MPLRIVKRSLGYSHLKVWNLDRYGVVDYLIVVVFFDGFRLNRHLAVVLDRLMEALTIICSPCEPIAL